jgi:hypothetical protein
MSISIETIVSIGRPARAGCPPGWRELDGTISISKRFANAKIGGR